MHAASYLSAIRLIFEPEVQNPARPFRKRVVWNILLDHNASRTPVGSYTYEFSNIGWTLRPANRRQEVKHRARRELLPPANRRQEVKHRAMGAPATCESPSGSEAPRAGSSCHLRIAVRQ